MMQKTILGAMTLFVSLASVGNPGVVLADQQISCESRNNQYHYCRVDTHGYVRMSRQLSKSACDQGRNWDFDRGGVWVDDGCRAEFIVEERTHSGSHSDHDSGKVVAAAAGLAILGALVAASHDDSDKHQDENYHGPRHSSYVPQWMQGDWQGYNTQYGKYVDLSIGSDGRVRAYAEGHQMQGYVNDGRLYVADAEFHIERAGGGFNTVEVGNHGNVVHYERP
jgi:hypothetical protein